MNTKKSMVYYRSIQRVRAGINKKLLAGGYTVAATSWNKKTLIDEMGAANETFLPIEMDLIQPKNVEEAIDSTYCARKIVTHKES